MSKEFLENFYIKTIEKVRNLTIVKRDLDIKIVKEKVISIIGPRRAGKTYFLFQIMKDIIENSLYLDFEDFLVKQSKSLEVLEFILTKNKKFVFLDEVQNLENWESLVRTLLNQGYKVFITGSSSKLLSKEIATQLRGRSLSYLLLPFSFKEFLKAKNFKTNGFITFEKKGRIMEYLKDYMYFGGYPEIVLKEIEKEKYLKEIIELVFFKDFVERKNIKNIKVAKLIFEYLLQNYTKEISLSRIKNYLNSLNLKPNLETVSNYLHDLEDTFSIFLINKFDYKVHLRESWPKKVYLVDNGLHLPFRFSDDKGKLMENLVFLHLKRQENEKPFQEIYYYKTKNNKEIDFLVKNKNKIELIEVCYEFDEDHKKKLIKAMNELKLKESFCITWDEEEIIEEKGKKIMLIPLWKWLLNNSESLKK